MNNNCSIFFQHVVPDPQSIIVTNNLDTIILRGSDITLTCSVQMNSSVLDSEISLLMVEAQLINPNGRMLSLSNPAILGTTFTFTSQAVKSFSDSDVGSYVCSATVRTGSSSPYLTGIGELSGKIELEIGEKQKQTCGPFKHKDHHAHLLSGIPSTTQALGNTGVIAGGVIVVIIVLLAVTVVALAVIFLFL